MKLYAETSKLRTLQVSGDVFMLSWCLLWAWIGHAIYDLIGKLAGPGNQLVDTSQKLDGGSSRLKGVLGPLGDGLGSLSDGLGHAGAAQVSVVHDIALFVALLVFLAPVLPPLVMYVVRRVIWMRSASAVLSLRHSPHFVALLAQRAVMHQPLPLLAKISDDPLGDLKEGNHAKLAALELARYGISPMIQRTSS